MWHIPRKFIGDVIIDEFTQKLKPHAFFLLPLLLFLPLISFFFLLSTLPPLPASVAIVRASRHQ
jgi:hypothetical protein